MATTLTPPEPIPTGPFWTGLRTAEETYKTKKDKDTAGASNAHAEKLDQLFAAHAKHNIATPAACALP
jgi:hypothetical protein